MRSILLPGLKEARECRWLTQAELAEKSGVSRASISKIENKQRGAHRDTVLKLAEALDTDLGELLRVPETVEDVVVEELVKK